MISALNMHSKAVLWPYKILYVLHGSCHFYKIPPHFQAWKPNLNIKFHLMGLFQAAKALHKGGEYTVKADGREM